MGIMSIVILILVSFSNLAVSAQTFTCTKGVFRDSIGKNKGDVDGQCVMYVRYETGILSSGCNGEAWRCYQEAITAGYTVGQKPRKSAIVVFNKVGTGALSVGHVGIVKSVDGNKILIRDSNWVAPYTVGEHQEDITERDILGYIYCDGKSEESQTEKIPFRLLFNLAWYPADKTCVNAEKWILSGSNGPETFTSNGVCYSQFSSLDYAWWWDIVFGSGDLTEINVCK